VEHLAGKHLPLVRPFLKAITRAFESGAIVTTLPPL
jgi:hypothetical protein